MSTWYATLSRSGAEPRSCLPPEFNFLATQRQPDFFRDRATLAGSAYDRRNSRANEAAPRENSSDKFARTERVSVPASPRVMTPLFHVYSIAVLKLRPGRKVGAITRRDAERFPANALPRHARAWVIIILNQSNGPGLRLGRASLVIFRLPTVLRL